MNKKSKQRQNFIVLIISVLFVFVSVYSEAAESLDSSSLSIISGGDAQSLAVQPDGTAWIWGDDYMGSNISFPEKMENFSDIVSVSSGISHSLALHGDGTVSMWGSETALEKVAGLTDIVAISAGITHSLALASDGTVWAWGTNRSGQLGDGTTNDRSTPVQVRGLSDVTAISAGGVLMARRGFSLALRKDGSVWAWGYNEDHSLGAESMATNSFSESMSSVPLKVVGIDDAVSISAGACHSLALLQDGSVVSWGCNDTNQLGLGDTEERSFPQLVPGISDVKSVSAGYHSLVLKDDSTVWGWGLNFLGAIGDGTIEERSVPTQTKDISDVVAISAGSVHSLAVKSDGTVWSWGWNLYGQLGDGTTEDRHLPVQVIGLDLIDENGTDPASTVDDDDEAVDQAPEVPVMALSVEDLKVTISWSSVKNANGYLLTYAPFPLISLNSIQNVDMGKTTELSLELWDGVGFYLTVQAYNEIGLSLYSNLRYFIIDKGFVLESPSFSNGDRIPDKNACTGDNVSPELNWLQPPYGIASFLLIMDDPDAPDGTWTHWVVYDIPSNYSGLSENLSTVAELEDGVKQAITDSGDYGYHGPCPPSGHGTHHYNIRLWGLDVESLGLSPGANYDSVISAAKSHFVCETTLMGTFSQ